MKRRSPAAPLLLPFVTFGIYALVWFAKTKNEINLVAPSRIPTTWLVILPIISYWWLWKFAVGVQETTGFSRAGAFWLLLLLGPIGAAIVQDSLNNSVPAPILRAGSPQPAVSI
ncbi:DUF4234 domain-containing protein [Cryobacterium sp. TMT1-21]|uniref:DUF4234 domain-containing protein n=1 Tax=Cryobacterium shii TaxID=1259235 RepID=A0AAQ2C538_9MICO|nr:MULTISPECIES: DUF4234 domain-containing protein [Cryobacterium]TFC44707.1 DUF4234 domain-containing protein [Cryobacterium shii]TFC85114.1 DUF4234 domain-containing protein [Cryobacterium sp. TmT2-59]TFD10227.1 DUF4234 domain-containing protein [Cryobacterium sp. TMT1-21]TFD11737.1 DUF4234 domain-containing protein [Cryobacterium sp. TMT4-10]TFD26122.1 DUF4234 domain-containing protein [Cryobacterium sp. TMT2-23]